MSAALEANLEEVTETVSGRVRRPITLMLLLVVGAVVIFAAGEPISAAVESGLKRRMRPAPPLRAVAPSAGVAAATPALAAAAKPTPAATTPAPTTAGRFLLACGQPCLFFSFFAVHAFARFD